MFEPDRFYSASEIVAEAHAPRDLVSSALEDGSLPAIRRGRRWWVPGRAVSAWIADLAAMHEGPEPKPEAFRDPPTPKNGGQRES